VGFYYMTLNEPNGGSGEPEEFLLAAERHFHRILQQVEGAIVRLEGTEAAAAKEAASIVRDLNKAAQTVFDERSKVEKLRKQTAGVVHDFALDFDAARDEIGRRMALLRSAERAGQLSE